MVYSGKKKRYLRLIYKNQCNSKHVRNFYFSKHSVRYSCLRGELDGTILPTIIACDTLMP